MMMMMMMITISSWKGYCERAGNGLKAGDFQPVGEMSYRRERTIAVEVAVLGGRMCCAFDLM